MKTIDTALPNVMRYTYRGQDTRTTIILLFALYLTILKCAVIINCQLLIRMGGFKPELLNY